MTYSEYLKRVATYYESSPPEHEHIRLGQCYFNVLAQERPDLAKIVIESNFDPFYQDSKLDEFCKWVEAKLDWILVNKWEIGS